MISTIIFSKNRACQLDLLLRSMEENFNHVSTNVRVLYTATNSEFEMGYSKLIDKFPNVIWDEEADFERDTRWALDRASEYVCFFVDDNIVYRPPPLTEDQTEDLFAQSEHIGCLSLRLGENTYIQDPHTNQRVALQHKIEYMQVTPDCKLLVWNWKTIGYNNFGYPFSVDGHIYKTQVVQDGLDYDFPNPNGFEGRFVHTNIPQIMCCPELSCVVNTPLNLVGSSNNKAGVKYGASLEELNTNFISGKTISLDTVDPSTVIGCHQEMELIYE